ncbi:MAG: DnaJ domain-containing protein [Chloroflexi bacterium]|nr:DnaJ domain-containing protein [Chloroflexota bacterium]
MEFKDYYQALGVSRTADQKEIKKAFRSLARQYHPDANPGDAQAADRFKEINEAYEVLSDPEKRAKYDQFGKEWQQYQHAGGAGFDWTNWAQATGAGGPEGGYRRTYTRVENLEDLFGGGSGFSDFFETLFGMGGRPGAGEGFQAQQRGRDIEQPVRVTLSEAYHGTTRSLNGGKPQVKIPAGVKTGSRIRIAGEGQPGINGGPSGDLYLVVDVAPDQRFERNGDNLYTEFELPLYTALLGGTATVTTLDGVVQLNIPPETQNGARFRLREKGMPRLKNPRQRGDLYASAAIRLPTNLSTEERELIKQLKDLRPSG